MSSLFTAAEATLHAICYDVSCNRERRRVAKLLLGYGFRVQKSVFECRLGKAQRLQLVAAIERLALKTGQVNIYKVYADARPQKLGAVREEALDEAFIYTL